MKHMKTINELFNTSYDLKVKDKLNTFWIATVSLINDFNFIYYMLYFLFAIFTMAIHPFYLAFHLTDIVVRSPLLK
jgi:hypothetical protein